MEEPLLPKVSQIACDASGVLYGLVSDSSSSRDLAGTIAVCDLRSQLVEKQAGQAAACPTTTFNDVQPSSLIHPAPALSFAAQSVAVAPSGRYLAISGFDHEDEDLAVVVVVDLHGSHPQESPGPSPLPSRGGRQQQAHTPPSPARGGGPRHKTCGSHVVDYSLFASRPGLTVRQMCWHPYSESHLLVLTSDSRLRLYHVANTSSPELVVHVKCAASQGAGSGRYGLSAASVAGEEAVAFAWGGSTGWGPLTLYVLSSVGALYTVCPFTAVGMRCASGNLHQALTCAPAGELGSSSGSSSGQDMTAWLYAAFNLGSVDEVLEEASWEVLPHVVDGLAPSLQGPLNAGSESVAPAPFQASALAALHHQHLPPAATRTPRTRGFNGASPQSTPTELLDIPAQSSLVTTTALVAGREDGRLWAHVLLESPSPSWSSSGGPPRVETGPGGEITCVRYECVADGAGGGVAVLLDAVELHGGLLGRGGREEEDDEEEGQGRLPLTLCPLSGAGGHTVVASHAVGSWAVELPWLPLVGQQLLQADLDMAQLPQPVVCELLAAAPSQGSDGEGYLRGACCIQDVFVGRAVLLLQDPGVLHCVRPGAVLAAAQAVLSPGPSQGSTGSAAAAAASPAGAAAGGSGKGAAGAGGARGDGDAVIDAAIQAVYADLVQPVVAPRLPTPAGGGVAAASPEGAAYLTSAIRALRQGGVECAHRTHAGLAARATQLNQEAAAHKASVAELAALMAEVERKQQELSARAAHALQLHTNLTERAALLTQLHWSLPRPLSDAEHQLSVDLDVAAARQHALQQAWTQLRPRANNALEKHHRPPKTEPASAAAAGAGVTGTRLGQHQQQQPTTSWWRRLGGVQFGSGPSSVVASSPGVGVGGVGGRGMQQQGSALRVPSAQLQCVQDTLMEHSGAISSCSAEVGRMQEQVRAWAQQSVCDDAASHLGKA